MLRAPSYKDLDYLCLLKFSLNIIQALERSYSFASFLTGWRFLRRAPLGKYLGINAGDFFFFAGKTPLGSNQAVAAEHL